MTFNFNLEVSVGFAPFRQLVETIHDYVWEPEDDEDE